MCSFLQYDSIQEIAAGILLALFILLERSMGFNVCQTSNYEDVARSAAYIDKTLFIKGFHEGPQFLVLTGPRRFSKSSNLDMLRYFYEVEVDERGKTLDPKKSKKLKLLEDKNIFLKHKTFFWKHFAQYPVLNFNFGNLPVTSYDGFLEELKIHLTKTVLPKFKYLKQSTNEEARDFYAKVTSPTYAWTESNLEESGHLLAKALKLHHGKKPMFLVDECDWPVMSAVHNPKIGETELDKVVRFLGVFVAGIVTHYDVAEKALLTGCMSIGANYPTANNLEQFTIFDKPMYYSAYGFLQQDIEVFRVNFSLTENNVQSLKRFYDGYNVFDHDQPAGTLRRKDSIYNTISVVKYLASGKKLDTYWTQTGSIRYLSPLLAYDKLGRVFETCLTDTCHAEIELNFDLRDLLTFTNAIRSGSYQVTNDDKIIQYFFEAGYLTPVKVDTLSGFYTFKVPNSEIRETLEKMLYLESDFLRKKYSIPSEVNAEYVEAMSSLSSDKNTLQRVVAAIDKIFEHSLPRNEDSMGQMLFYPLLQSREFERVRTEEYAEKGRYGFFGFRLRDQTAFVLEMKYRRDSSECAQGQIVNTKNKDLLDQVEDIRDKVMMGISLNKQNKTEVCYKYVNCGKETR